MTIYQILFLIALVFGLVACGDAVSLQITGCVTGTGLQNLSFSGDLLNVSLSQNGSSWNLSVLGGMA